mgnify:FL=1|jgi:hypothetical protein|tara:strand:- start:196 stop:594 length:399 start_codon:yes stop_codon:yes gene_type:complete
MLLVACSATVTEPELADVVAYFREQGLTVGENEVFKRAAAIGAVDGFGIDVEGAQIELYMFDAEMAPDETLTQNTLPQSLEDTHRLEGFTWQILDDSPVTIFQVVMNGNIMLTSFDEHPEKEKIIEVFKNFR